MMTYSPMDTYADVYLVKVAYYQAVNSANDLSAGWMNRLR